jgi:hypothetical protein
MSTLAERRMHEQEAREVACRATIGAPWPARPTPAPGSELLSWTEALHVQYRVSGEATQRLAQLEARRTEALRTIAAAEADSLAADFGAIVAAQAAADLLERTLPAARTRVDRAAEDASLAEQARSQQTAITGRLVALVGQQVAPAG